MPAARAAEPLSAEAAKLINELRSKTFECSGDDEAALDPARARLVSARQEPRPRLAWNAQLAAAAETHARAMSEQAFFDHVDPEGRTVAQRSSAAGYRWRVIGENLAAGHPDVAEALKGWLASPSHCRNLFDERFTEFGLAKVSSAYPTDPYGVYWVLVLGKPKSGDVAMR